MRTGADTPARSSARRRSSFTCLGLALAAAFGCASPQRSAYLGDLVVESGETIRDCRIGYRTFGQLDATRSNAVLLTPWFLGTSRQLSGLIGPGKLVDSSRYFVIAVDALGNGVSSSPSTSELQPGAAFPRLTVRDVVEAEYRLLTQVLHLAHLRAVVGISFGGMQTFEWVVSHPGFMDRAVSITGSPRSVEHDRQHWREAIERVAKEPGWRRALQRLGQGEPLQGLQEARLDRFDYERQADAISAHDVSERHGSMSRAAELVRARLLVVVSRRDELVDPGPALEFAALAGARVLQLDGRCGHRAPDCERATLRPAVASFLGDGT